MAHHRPQTGHNCIRSSPIMLRGFLLLLLLLCVIVPSANARPVAGLAAPVVLTAGAVDGAAAWADYDNDGDLDLLVTGMNYTGQRATLLFRNEGGTLTQVSSGLPRAEGSTVDWGDYDNDGYLDVLLTGAVGFSGGQVTGLAGVYRNIPNPSLPEERIFSLGAALPNIHQGDGKWGDFNNDGRLDVLLTGYTTGATPVTRIYHNSGSGAFNEATGISLTGLGASSAACGDYDNDNYLDFVVNGREADGTLRALVYRNDSGEGFYAPTALTGMWGGAPAWIDIENDGDLDLLLTGNRGDSSGNILPTTLLYRWKSGSFTAMNGTGLPNLWETSIAVGDYNNDGFSDLLLNGLTTSKRPTAIYINNQNFTFTSTGASLPDGASISTAWGDYDRDGALDALLSGVRTDQSYVTQLYANNNPAPPANTPPSAPVLRAACWDGANRLTLEWYAAYDDHSGIQYNLRAGSTPNAINIQNPQSDLYSGTRQLARPGNAYANQSAVLRVPLPSVVKWSVQGVDATFTGGLFSNEAWAYPGTAVAQADTYTTSEDTPTSINLLENDNHDYAPLSIYRLSNPDMGTLVETGTGVYTFTPNPDWNGSASLSYSAIGSHLYCSKASVTINVTPVNDAPWRVSVLFNAVREELPIGTTVGTLITLDPDLGDTHTYTLAPDGADDLDNALFSISGSTLRTAAVFSYSTAQQYTVNVRSADAAGLERTDRLTIHVLPYIPVSIECASNCAGYLAVPKSVSVEMSEDSAPVPFNLALRAVTPDGAEEALEWSLVTPPARGSASFDPGAGPGAEQVIQYTPAGDEFGADSFVLSARDTQGNSDQITINVTVAPVNDPPALDAIDDITLAEDAVELSVALNGLRPGPANEAGQPLTITVETNNPGLLRDMVIDWDGASPTGTLHFTLGEGGGEAIVTVTADDGQGENSLTERSFSVFVPHYERVYLPLVVGP